MDTEMKDLLKAWDLEELCDDFEQNGIDLTTVECLTTDLIKELIPKIGLRIRFTNKLKEHYAAKCSQAITTKDHIVPLVEDQTTTNSETDLNNKQSNTDSESNSSSDATSHKLVRQNCFHVRSPFKRASSKTYTNIDVKKLLRSTASGKCILKSYQKGKSLSRKSRSLLVDLIITESLQGFNGYKSAINVDFEDIAAQIEKIFPEESTSTYYIPPVKKRISRTQKPITARGKLVDKYRNKLRDYRKLAGCDISCESSATESVASDISSDEVQNSMTWLQHNREPWDLVLKHWKLTSLARHGGLNSPIEKVETFLDKWPVLRQSRGYALIDLDYTHLYKPNNQTLFSNWDNFFCHLQSIRTVNNEKNAEALIELLAVDTLTTDCKVVIQMLLLPYLIPPRGRIRIQKRHWKPSITECQKSLILHVKIPGDLLTAQRNRIEEVKQLGLTVQPYIIVVGPTLDSLKDFYVSLDATLYQVPTALKAIDICFKSFHAVNATYPPESEHIWYLIQLSLYNLTTKWDKQISYVADIAKSMPQFEN